MINLKLVARLDRVEDGANVFDFFRGDVFDATYSSHREAIAAAQASYLGQDEDGLGVIVATVTDTDPPIASELALMDGTRLDG